MDVRNYRLAFVIVLLLYVGALLAPARQIKSASRYERLQVTNVKGWELARFGWMGPLGLTFGWYANFPLVVCAARMLRGRSPGWGLARVAGVLAASSLLPFGIYSEVDGMHRGYVRGPAVWLWLAAFAVTAEVTWSGRRRVEDAESRRE